MTDENLSTQINSGKDEIHSILTNSSESKQKEFLINNENFSFTSGAEILILDSFFSDKSDYQLVKKLLNYNETSKIRILMANPFGQFAKKQHSIIVTEDQQVTPITKIITGLQNIYCAIHNVEPSPIVLEGKNNISDLLEEIRKSQTNKKLEIKFYNSYPWGPLYIFPHFLIFGHFSVAKDCIESSWYKIYGPESRKNSNNLYNEYKDEFEEIWVHKHTINYEPNVIGVFVKKFSNGLFMSLAASIISGWFVS